MKRIYIACLIALLVAMGLVFAIQTDAGYIVINYNGHMIKTSFWVGLALFMALFALLCFIAIITRTLIVRGTLVGQWFSGRKQRRSQQLTTEGFIAYIEGNWERARKLLAKSAKQSQTPLLNYLFAARASNELGDEEKTKQFLKSAELSTSAAAIAVDLAHAEIQLSQGRYEQALATLIRLREQADKQPYVLKLLKTVYVKLDDWIAMAGIVADLKRFKLVSSSELNHLELKAAKAQLSQASGNVDDLKACWSNLSKVVTRQSAIVAYYARLLIEISAFDVAEQLIRQHLKKDWQPELVNLYGRINLPNNTKLLIHAEGWLKERNNDSALFLCLGRISVRNQLWGKAKEYFENSLKLEKNAETYFELGRLSARLDEHEKSSEYFHLALSESEVDLPPLS